MPKPLFRRFVHVKGSVTVGAYQAETDMRITTALDPHDVKKGDWIIRSPEQLPVSPRKPHSKKVQLEYSPAEFARLYIPLDDEEE